MKKLISLVLALCMMLTIGAAFAAEGAPADTSISISGLEAGDVVDFYQVLKYDETASATGGWVAAAGFTNLTQDNILQILGKGDYASPDGSKKDQAGISAALAATIATMAQAQGVTPKFADVTVASGTASHATTAVGDAGLYLALVTPGTADWLYNPVFVAADYTTGGTNSQAAVTTLSYSPASMAKKEKITFSKEIDGTEDTKYDVNVGDTVPFTITSKVPAYSASYQEPSYVITDTMEEGLELQGIPTVSIAGITLADTDYTISPATIAATDHIRTFTVTMTATGLAKVSATGTAQDITVKYNAKVVSLENATVSEKENEATVRFSNNPADKTSYSLLEDKTRNYSFTIDGNLLGYTGTSYETDELIKTGLNADGSPITETKKYRSGTKWTDLAPLTGAVFTLYEEDGSTVYTNPTFNGTVTSDSNGRLKITGLDAGTYKLKETSAPAGFIADDRTFTITIRATYTEIAGGTYTNADGILVKYDAYKVLDTYTVTVNDGTNNVTSTYDIENQGPVDHKKVDKATWQALEGGDMAGDSVTPISNTKGTELPSTGGIGTTIFYILGGLLVVGAAVILVARRKAQD